MSGRRVYKETVMDRNTQANLNTILSLINDTTQIMCNITATGQRMKAQDPNHHLLPALRAQYRDAAATRHDAMVKAVEMYAPHCKKCGGKGYFPQYAHRDGGKCYSCNHPNIQGNVIFKNIDFVVTAAKANNIDRIMRESVQKEAQPQQKETAPTKDEPISSPSTDDDNYIPVDKTNLGQLINGTFHMPDDEDMEDWCGSCGYVDCVCIDRDA